MSFSRVKPCEVSPSYQFTLARLAADLLMDGEAQTAGEATRLAADLFEGAGIELARITNQQLEDAERELGATSKGGDA